MTAKFRASEPTVHVPVPPGFAFDATVTSHGWYRLAPFAWAEDAQRLTRFELLAGRPYQLEISFVRGRLAVRGAPDSSELRLKLIRMFQLKLDIGDFARMAAESPGHAWVVESGFGRLLCGATLFEDIVKIIATTNTTWGQTVRMVALLTDKCGVRSATGVAFPRAQDVIRFSRDELQRDCKLGYRATTIHALAAGVVSGEIDLARIADATQSTAELLASYRTLPGIGPYGAAHLLAMDGRHDFIAVDSEFRRYVRETYHAGRVVSDAAMLRRFTKWGRWKYLAYWSELRRG